MALTALQVAILRLLSERRMRSGESYVAGGVALNHVLQAPRLSQDIDLFHDTDQALLQSWQDDRELLRGAGYSVEVVHEAPGFIDAEVGRDRDAVLVQWARDSAFRFFPLMRDETLGLTLHPYDLATNKALALAGRLEPRDWIDLINCHEAIQPLGCLAWAACGKDPGFTPEFIIDAAAAQRYAQEEIDLLAFVDGPPSAAELGGRWKQAVREAREIIARLPVETLGCCVLDRGGRLWTGPGADLEPGGLLYHRGTIGGALPTVRPLS
jgi:hypothetical protein